MLATEAGCETLNWREQFIRLECCMAATCLISDGLPLPCEYLSERRDSTLTDCTSRWGPAGSAHNLSLICCN